MIKFCPTCDRVLEGELIGGDDEYYLVEFYCLNCGFNDTISVRKEKEYAS